MTILQFSEMLKELPDNAKLYIINPDTVKPLFDGADELKEIIVCKQNDATPAVYLCAESVGVF